MPTLFNASTADFLRRSFGYQFPRVGSRLMGWCLRGMPDEIYCELFPGIRIKMNLRDLTQRSTFWQGSRYEAPTARILIEQGRGAKIFFDIGANYGFFSYWMLHRLPEIEVYAFEPNPKILDLIRRAKTDNAIDRIHPQGVGLSDSAESLALRLGTADSGHSTFANHPGLNGPVAPEIPVLAFDQWVERTGLAEPEPGQWIAKVDVEGFETKVLTGMREALAKKAFRLLVVEINEFTLALTGTTPELLSQFLRERGYVELPGHGFAGRGKPARNANGFFVPAAQ